MDVGKPNRVLIAANPKSGASDRIHIVQGLCDELQLLGLRAEIVRDLQEFERLAEAYSLNHELHSVVAAGGDGTVSAVVSRVPQTIPICIFPLGTENLLAKQIGATADPGKAAGAILRHSVRRFDAGFANEKLFLVVVGVGFDAVVVDAVHRRRSGHIRKWNYAWPIIRSTFTYRFPKLQIEIHSRDLDPIDRQRCLVDANSNSVLRFEACWLFVSNFARYANGLSVNPEATGTDGWLDIGTFEKGGVLHGLWYLSKLWFGQHTQMAGFQKVRAKKILVSSNEEVLYQLDGDSGGTLPLEIRIEPARIILIEPS